MGVLAPAPRLGDGGGMPVMVGTSGWVYDDWRGDFYPPDLPRRRWLQYYAGEFGTVEVNNAFYRLPRREVFEGWRDTLPDGFVVAVKASRFLTHIKRLTDPAWADRGSRPVTPLWQTTSWGYLRLHEGGATPWPSYGRTALESWADRLGAFDDAYAYFNNDQHGAAPRDAVTFR